MIDRRELMLGLGAAAMVVPSVATADLFKPHNCFDHCGDGCKGLCGERRWRVELDEIPHRFVAEAGTVHDRDPGLKLAWEITDGHTPQEMHAALTAYFGPFPIWFVDDKAHVVIKGVSPYPTPQQWRHNGMTPKGYLQCDARIIRMRGADGAWQERDTLERPLRIDGGYVTW